MASLKKTIDTIARKARSSSRLLGDTQQDKVDNCLRALALLLDERKDAVVKANRKDIALARKKNLSGPMIDRLTLTDKAFDAMKKGLNVVAGLSTPVGSVLTSGCGPTGLPSEK